MCDMMLCVWQCTHADRLDGAVSSQLFCTSVVNESILQCCNSDVTLPHCGRSGGAEQVVVARRRVAAHGSKQCDSHARLEQQTLHAQADQQLQNCMQMVAETQREALVGLCALSNQQHHPASKTSISNNPATHTRHQPPALQLADLLVQHSTPAALEDDGRQHQRRGGAGTLMKL